MKGGRKKQNERSQKIIEVRKKKEYAPKEYKKARKKERDNEERKK